MKSVSIMARTLGLLSVAGMTLAACAAPPVPDTAAGSFLDQVNAHFAAWDTNHDNALSATEVELALTNPAIKGPEAAAVASLRRGMKADRIESLTLPQISQSVAPAAPGAPVSPHYVTMYKSALAKIESTSHDLFPDGQPDMSTLAQGRLGDCFLMAALGTYTYHNPQGLKKMVQVQPDGDVAVTFGTGRKVVLPAPTDGEIVIGSTTRGHGVWGNVMEKAVGEVLLSEQKTARYPSPYSIIGVGGSPHTVLEMLTGHTTERISCEPIRKLGVDPAVRAAKLQEMRDALTKAQTEGRMIVCGNGPYNTQAKVPGIFFLHSYGVLNYDAKTDLVTFWNPMSNAVKPKGDPGLQTGYPTSFGKFTVPLTQVVEWLSSFTIETDKPMPTTG